MTEQDVNNTLHSFDVIKQYQASGQSFEDYSENRTTKESIGIDYPEEKSLDENMDFNQLPSFLDNEEDEQDEVLDLTSKSRRSL